MASKAVPGRGITLPFVEGLHGTPFYFKLNPYVTLYSCVLIWGFIVYTISMRWDAYKEFQTWFQWVTDEWTWLWKAHGRVRDPDAVDKVWGCSARAVHGASPSARVRASARAIVVALARARSSSSTAGRLAEREVWASCARAITRRPCTSCIACCTRPRA